MNQIDIFVTLGPSSLNKKFLNFVKNKASLVRLNMSHINLSKLEKKIIFIKKYCSVPICIDTEGGQIRIKANRNTSKRIKLKDKIVINKQQGNYNFYPEEVFNLLKKKDILDVGFEGLQLKVLNKKNGLLFKA